MQLEESQNRGSEEPINGAALKEQQNKDCDKMGLIG